MMPALKPEGWFTPGWLGLWLLLGAVIASSVLLVYSKHESRKLFAELQRLQQEQDQMNIEWGRLQLEQSAWSTHGRIERLAQKKLGMHIPPSDEVMMLSLDEKK